jgi:hypothetical protein
LLGGIAPVMPLPGSVAAGGSLAGNDISNSSESCRSSSFLDFCRFASFLAFLFSLCFNHLVLQRIQMDPLI